MGTISVSRYVRPSFLISTVKHNYTVTIPWHECKRILGAFADAMVSADEE